MIHQESMVKRMRKWTEGVWIEDGQQCSWSGWVYKVMHRDAKCGKVTYGDSEWHIILNGEEEVGLDGALVKITNERIEGAISEMKSRQEDTM